MYQTLQQRIEMVLIDTIAKNKVITDVEDNSLLPQASTLYTQTTLEFDDEKLAAHGQDMMAYMEGFVQAIDDDTVYIWNKTIEYKVKRVAGNLLILELAKVNNLPVANYAVSNDNLFQKLLTKVNLRVCTVKHGQGVVEGSDRPANVNDSYLFTSKYDMVSELNKNGTAIGNGVNILYKEGVDIKETLMRAFINSKGKAVNTILGKLLDQMVKVEHTVL